MFFRNLSLFRFPFGVIGSREAFADALGARPLREIGPLELSVSGFASPYRLNGAELAHFDEQYVLFTVAWIEKLLPAAVVNEALANKVDEIAEREGRRVGGKERRRLREDLITEMLPRAFQRPRRVNAYVDLRGGWLVIDTASRRVAEEVVSEVREALGRFPATPMAPEASTRALMTDWVISGKLPKELALGEDCLLRDPEEAGALVRCRRQDLESDEVREHLKSGKQVFEVGLEYSERMSFVLTEDLGVRKLRFLDVAVDQLASQTFETAADEMHASFSLMAREISVLLCSFDAIFGLPRPLKPV